MREQGLDMNEGMVLKMGGHFYHGAECINRLAILSSSAGLHNLVNRWILRRSYLSRLLYPALCLGRNVSLCLLGRGQIPPLR